MDKEQILRRIEELMVEKGVSKYQLKEHAEISSTIYQWKKNAARDKDRVPSLRTIEKICDYFDVSLSYFFAFTKEEQRSVNEREIADRLRLLSDEQVMLVKELLMQFRDK